MKYEEFVLVLGYHQACVALYDYAQNANTAFATRQGWKTLNTSRSPGKSRNKELVRLNCVHNL